MDILRDLRRRSLQLDSDDVERFRMASASERRASMNVGLAAEKKAQHYSKFSVQRSPFSYFILKLYQLIELGLHVIYLNT